MEKNINLQLGDIIELTAPSNKSLHQKIYFIKYINSEKIVLINQETEFVLKIRDNNELYEESIESINLLSRSTSPSYAIQNNLNPNTWISIYFSGTLPIIINGVITNLENDMIEIKTYPKNEYIYIDFEYKGVPESLNIEKIKIIDSIEQENEEAKDIDHEKMDQLHEYKDQLKEIILDADAIQIGKRLDEIKQVINVNEDKLRYSITQQLSDLLDDMLSNIPNANRSEVVLNDIHLEIERFRQLRIKVSIIDDIDNVVNLKIMPDDYNPLIENFYKMNYKLSWILPVVINIKKIYDIEEEDDNKNINIESIKTFISNIYDENELWKANQHSNEQNKYKTYIHKLLDQFKPYINPDLYENNYIYTNETNSDIDVIVDNLGTLNNYCINNSILTTDKFDINRYISASTMIQTINDYSTKINKLINIDNNDELIMKSLVLLPKEMVKFSNINLPYTNILNRATLNYNFRYYKLILNSKTFVNTNIIDTKTQAEDSLYDVNNVLLNHINHFVPEDYIEQDDDDNIISEKFKNFITKSIPSKTLIFKYLKTHIDNVYNINDLLMYIQPFLINSDNINNNDMITIQKTINKNIHNYKKLLNKSQIIDSKYIAYVNKSNFIALLLSSENLNEVLELYNITDQNISDSELLSKVLKIDNAKLLFIAFNKSIVNIVISDLLKKLNRYSENQLKASSSNEGAEEETQETPGEQESSGSQETSPGSQESPPGSQDTPECNKYVLSKKYVELDELENDNDKTIYFDKQYDKTMYDIMDEYREERATMSAEEFFNFLATKLQENIGLDEQTAKRDAKTMIEKKREVIENDYAVLTSTNEIYIRKNNKWEKESTLNVDKFFESNRLFCTLQKNCVATKDKCLDKKAATNEFQQNLLSDVLKDFDNNYEMSIEKIREQLDKQYENYKLIIKKQILFNKHQILKYNTEYNKLALDIDLKSTIQSPYDGLKTKIFGLKDFAKRQNNILKFCKFFTRSAFKDENQFWLYCIKTNTKLMPTFILQLAHCFVNKRDYALELDTICAERGTISDDGNMWVDKYSGYIIKTIEFNNEEGFDEKGYKLITREIIENDYSIQDTNIIEGDIKNDKKEYSNSTNELISRIIKAITQFIGVDLSKYNEFIINNVLEIHKKNIPSREEYEKLLKKTASTSSQKTLPSYKDAFNTSIIILTLIFILISIQISIPNITTKKIFPGCIKSFSGYPFISDTDRSGLIYIACIANKIKSSIEPWNSIIKMSEKTLIKKMEAIIEKFVLSNKTIKELVREKQQYLQLNPESLIPEELDVKNWTNFLPPLIDYKISADNLIPIERLREAVIENIKKYKGDQFISTLLTKIKFYTLEIIHDIQIVVNKSVPLLSNNSDVPFLENGCCNENQYNTIKYFIEKDRSIEKYNKMIDEHSYHLHYINQLNKANIYFYPFSTKPAFPNIETGYSESTIYRGIIHYCKFNSDMPVDDKFKSICGEKPMDINYNSDIGEIINRFKSEGKNYNTDDLNALMDIVNKQNLIDSNYNTPSINNIEILRQLIKNSIYNNILSDEFIEKFTELLDTFELNQTAENLSLREMKNYLAREISNYQLRLTIFFDTNSKLSKKSLTNIKNYFNMLNRMEDKLITDDNTNYWINIMKNSINNLINVFPNIILNKVDTQNISDIKHWDLSLRHNKDIENIISSYYTIFNKFYDDEELIIIIKNIVTKLKPLITIINNIYYLSSISSDGTSNNSIFDKTLTIQLLKYIQFIIIYGYIDILDNDLIKQELFNITEDEEPDTDIEKYIQIKISDLLNGFIEIISDSCNIIDYNINSIVNKITKSKEQEKESITEYLKNLTDEERKIENIFKNNKLEQWGIGLQKGMTQYVKETYDSEMAKMEQQAIMDIKMGDKGITEMNKEIFNFEMALNDEIEQGIEAEEFNMGNIPDDDDFEPDDVGGIDDDNF